MKRTMTKRFYCGSADLARRNENGEQTILDTLNETIDRAKEKLERDEADVIYIVEIIKVVRRQQQPIIVEDIRK